MRHSRRWSLLSLLLAACQGEAPPVAENSEPFGPVQMTSGMTKGGATPMFLTTPDGDQVLSWVAEQSDTSPGRLVVQVRQLGKEGGLWRVASVTDPLGGIESHGEAPPQIAGGGSNRLYALYLVGKDVGERYPVGALRLVRSIDGGVHWSEPVSVNEGDAFGSHNFHSLAAGRDGSVYASWLSNTGKAAVWLRVSRDGGKNWEKARQISTGEACPCCRTAVAVGDSGRVYMAWRDVATGDVRDIVVASSADQGATWSAPVKPRDDGWVFPGCPHAGPSLRVDRSGAVHIAWWTGRTGAAGVWYARSTDRGVTWTATPVDTAERSAPMHVQLLVDNAGRVVVGWDGGTGATPQVFVRASGDSGLHFGRREALSDPTQAATFPVLGLRGDSLTVAWTQVADSAYRHLLEHQKEPEGAHERMQLPRVGAQEIFTRVGLLSRLISER